MRAVIYGVMALTIIVCPFMSLRVAAVLVVMFMFSMDVAQIFEPSEKDRKRPGDWWNYS